MRWKILPLLAASLPFVAYAGGVQAEETRLSGPFVHENLAVYFVHGASTPGPVPLTLAEALAAGKAIVHETGDVNRLSVENDGDEEVFIQAGDIVKGGQQDRVLTVSLIVPPRSGRLDIDAYCVEQGRWSARGKEDVRRFASANSAVPSREAKLAMLKPRKSTSGDGAVAASAGASDAYAAARVQSVDRTARSETSARQAEMWASVASAQRKLTQNLGAPVAAPASASSLQLTLENAKLAEARAGFAKALADKGRDGDIVGYVIAVGGKLNSGDVYGSHGLFAKMWSKQLDAAITEAIAEHEARPGVPPGTDAVRAFLARAEAGNPSAAPLAGTPVVRESRDGKDTVLTETRRGAGPVLHRSYLAF